MPTADILTLLVSENADIAAIFTFAYTHPALLQQRLRLSRDEEAILAKATALRAASRLPFWEALMLSCFDEQHDVTRLLSEATFHQSHRDSLLRISRDQVLAGRLAELVEAQPKGHNVSFSSIIELNSEECKQQLAMLDFHCPETSENDRLVSEVCRHLFRRGALIFSSGESYHALGLDSMEELEFRNFLTRSLLFAPIVDARYVAHQLLEGACALRLSTSSEKPSRPRLKFTLEDNHEGESTEK
jgi:hypothetical protein